MTKTKQTPRVLPADVYDALELSALVHGGVGADSLTKGGCPLCLYGHAYDLDDGDGYGNEAHRALKTIGVTAAASNFNNARCNDEAVRAINERNGVADLTARVPFTDLMAELNVVRGS